MRVLISVAIWGQCYAGTFCRYSLASQLAPNNIPRLAREHEVTYHIVTTRPDSEWLRAQPAIAQLEKHCRIQWAYIEDLGLDPKKIPVDNDSRKYPFLSRLQNLTFAISQDHDALVFNYADFIWADGSLINSIAMLQDGDDAVLSFCLPVDQQGGMKALDRYRNARNAALRVPARRLARLAIDNLHTEARLRFWDSPVFTSCPTYLLWKVGTDGVLIRAYHQTVYALRVRHDDPQFRLGIPRGTLDGYFTSTIADNGRVRHATNSDQVMVFSLYHASIDTKLRDQSREAMLRHILKSAVSLEQRRFAEAPIRIKAGFTDARQWEKVERESWDLLRGLHQAAPFDREAFDRNLSGGAGPDSNTSNALAVQLKAFAARVKRLLVGFARRLRHAVACRIPGLGR